MNSEDKNKAFSALITLGITRVEISFSGGNDEGGADSIIAYNLDHEEIKFPQSKAYKQTEYNTETKKWDVQGWVVNEGGVKRAATDQEIASVELTELVEQPIYDEYYSFAGEFYVEGTLIWDVLEGEVYMERNEEVKHMEYSRLDF